MLACNISIKILAYNYLTNIFLHYFHMIFFLNLYDKLIQELSWYVLLDIFYNAKSKPLIVFSCIQIISLNNERSELILVFQVKIALQMRYLKDLKYDFIFGLVLLLNLSF